MKSNFHYIIVLLFLNTICLSHMAFGQIVGNDIFLKGKYVEIGICKVGAFGSDETAPEGYHPRAGTGCSNFCLGFVADPDMDGFEVGAPAYIGDFFVPGTPQEGWDIQIGLDRIGGWRGYTGTAFTSISGGSGILDGGNVGIDTVGSEVQAIWEGAHLTSGLIIKKKTILDTNKVFFIVEVTLENPTGETIDSIYYNRTVDADNIAAMRPVPGPWIYDDFQTDNRIDMQPDATDNRALVSCVTSALLSYVDVSTYLGLASDDCRATVYIIDDDLFPRPGFFGDGDSLNLITLSNRTWPDFLFDVGLGGYADVGVGIVFNIGAIEPGGKAVFSYAYILRAADIDSAFIKLKPKWNLDIGALGSSDTIEACVGSVLEVNLSAHSGYTWSTWLPTDGLDTPVGLPNRITVGVDTITYRLVGTSLVCPTNDTMVLTVIPIIQPPPGADSFGTVCLGSSGIDLYDYLSEGTILGGVFNGAGVTEGRYFNPDIVGIGIHEVTYNVFVNGCLAFSKVFMTVENNVEINFDFELKEGCNGDTVIFTNNSEEGNYKWNFGDGNYIEGIENPNYFYATQGEYEVWLTVRNAKGCFDSSMRYIDTRHLINAEFNVDQDSICQGGSVYFTSVSEGNISQYYWDFGNGVTSNIVNASNVYENAGVYEIMHVVNDNIPCYDTAYTTVYVDSTGFVNLQADTYSICQGESIHFTIDYLNTSTLLNWDFGDGYALNSNDASIEHGYDNIGTYMVSVMSSFPICPDISNNISIEVKPLPIVNLGNDTSLCLDGNPFLLYNLNTDNFGDVKYTWSTGVIENSIQINHPGVYTLYANLNGCIGSDEIEVVKDCYVDIPNAFTPNGDGNNDYFFPRQLLSNGVQSFNMEIYNRWGLLIFQTNKLDGRGWDGNLNGVLQPIGTYIYQISVKYKNNVSESYNGNVNLLR